jgi:hypothetical protein
LKPFMLCGCMFRWERKRHIERETETETETESCAAE